MNTLAVLGLLAVSNTASAQSLEIDGACPGVLSISGSGFTPGGSVAVLRGTSEGSSAMPGGPCAGGVTDLDGLSYITTIPADGSGSFSARPDIAAASCGSFIQMLDASTCALSNTATLGEALPPSDPWPDTCAAALATPALTTGSYFNFGDTSTYTNALDLADPGPSCTTYPSAGNDIIVPVRLEAGESISAVHTALDGDASIYLVTSCRDSTSTLACADATLLFEAEVLRFSNDSGLPLDAYLVLDAYADGSYAPFASRYETSIEIF